MKTDEEKILSIIGEPALMEQLAEECAELSHACLKIARILRGENFSPKSLYECKANAIEEMADVYVVLKVCLGSLGWVKGNKRLLNGIIERKMNRWVSRLENVER